MAREGLYVRLGGELMGLLDAMARSERRTHREQAEWILETTLRRWQAQGGSTEAPPPQSRWLALNGGSP